MNVEIAGRYYRLGLGAAKRRDLSTALRHACFACILDPGHDDAAHLAEICRYELGENRDEAQERVLKQIGVLAGQKKWKAAVKVAQGVSPQNVRFLNVQGCLWALAKRYARAADCFAQALAQDRGNMLAADALVELGRRRTCFWRFF
ncbi:MAG: hypothetical protein LBP76_09175 [Treponema sp.]|jgi:tetratricopeptide (TPR) repeat protein|nr:hypothetical protein [Treponema sp.]